MVAQWYRTRTAIWGAVVPGMLLGVSSCSTSPLYVADGGRSLRSVPVPIEWTRALAPDLPEELVLTQGERIVRQECSLDASGEFALTVTVERDVGRIGVSVAELDERAAWRYGVSPRRGVLVGSTVDRGPASSAGLRDGDVIVRFGGEDVLSVDQLASLVQSERPGTTLPVEFLRRGEAQRTSVRIGSHAELESERRLVRKVPVFDDMKHTGLVVAELSEEVEPFVLGPHRTEDGVLVVDVLPGGPAFLAGLRHRDYIVSIAGEEVDSLAAYRRVLDTHDAGESVPFQVWRGDQLVLASVSLEQDAASKSRFDLAGFIEYENGPERAHFSLLWGLVFRWKRSYEIEERGAEVVYASHTLWGAGLDLIRFESEPDATELQLLWLFPIRRTNG